MESLYEKYKVEGIVSLSSNYVNNYIIPKNPDVVFIDVRPKEERSVSMLPNAKTIDDLNKNKEAYKNKTLIFYCTLGIRSAHVAKEFKEQDFKAFNLKYGVLGWAHENRPFERNGISTNEVHTYSDKWNALPEDYIYRSSINK